MPKKSAVMVLGDIQRELVRDHWGFMPYEVLTKSPQLDRFSTPIEVKCKNCTHVMVKTFNALELMHEHSGYYCPECEASFNPVFESKLPEEFVETNPEYISELRAEYSTMLRIKETLGYQPYRFVSYLAGKRVTLEHKECSSIFTATLSMILGKEPFVDQFTGEHLRLPYCPKCNEIFQKEGVNYAGARMVEGLATNFEAAGFEFPYVFKAEDIYRFKSMEVPMPVGCKLCGHTFVSKAADLYDFGHKSHCPHCKGVAPKDSAERETLNASVEAKQNLAPANEESSKQSNTALFSVDEVHSEEPIIEESYVPEEDSAVYEDFDGQNNFIGNDSALEAALSETLYEDVPNTIDSTPDDTFDTGEQQIEDIGDVHSQMTDDQYTELMETEAVYDEPEEGLIDGAAEDYSEEPYGVDESIETESCRPLQDNEQDYDESSSSEPELESISSPDNNPDDQANFDDESYSDSENGDLSTRDVGFDEDAIDSGDDEQGPSDYADFDDAIDAVIGDDLLASEEDIVDAGVFDGYNDEYAPGDISEAESANTVYEFSNPDVVDSTFDTMNEMIDDMEYNPDTDITEFVEDSNDPEFVEPVDETFDEFVESMHDIVTDMTATEDSLESDDSLPDVESSEEFLSDEEYPIEDLDEDGVDDVGEYEEDGFDGDVTNHELLQAFESEDAGDGNEIENQVDIISVQPRENVPFVSTPSPQINIAAAESPTSDDGWW